MEPNTTKKSDAVSHGAEREWSGPGWKHPYVLYIGATIVLFGFLILMGYLAIENEWIPKR